MLRLLRMAKLFRLMRMGRILTYVRHARRILEDRMKIRVKAGVIKPTQLFFALLMARPKRKKNKLPRARALFMYASNPGVYDYCCEVC